MYLVFTLLLPIPYLRKVTSSTLIFGALLSIIIPTLMEHILSNYIIGQFNQSTMIMHKFSNVLPLMICCTKVDILMRLMKLLS